MTKSECDICKREVKERYSMYTLDDKYQSAVVKEVCPDCYKEISEMKSRIEEAAQAVTTNWILRFIERLKK